MPKNKSTQTPVASSTPAAQIMADVQAVLEMATEAGLDVEEQSSFYKIAKDRKALYVSKSKRALARIDLAGFSIDHAAVVQVSEDEAKERKLGKVRGQIFPKTAGTGWEEAVAAALAVLNDGQPGIKFQRGLTTETPVEAPATEELAADRGPRRRRGRTSRIPVL